MMRRRLREFAERFRCVNGEVAALKELRVAIKERDIARNTAIMLTEHLAVASETAMWAVTVAERMGAERDDAKATVKRLASDIEEVHRPEYGKRLAERDAAIARNAELTKALYGARRQMGPPGDWACVDCRPDSDCLRDGFKCWFHMSLDVADQAPAAKTEAGCTMEEANALYEESVPIASAKASGS